MRAIIIDDSRAMRCFMRRIMVSLGFEVFEACDGQDALSKLTSAPPPEVALVDWNMPNMNGLEFVKAIRANHAFDSMQIVMATTEVELGRVAMALDAGANEYIMKPFTPEIVLEKLGLLQAGTDVL